MKSLKTVELCEMIKNKINNLLKCSHLNFGDISEARAAAASAVLSISLSVASFVSEFVNDGGFGDETANAASNESSLKSLRSTDCSISDGSLSISMSTSFSISSISSTGDFFTLRIFLRFFRRSHVSSGSESSSLKVMKSESFFFAQRVARSLVDKMTVVASSRACPEGL